METIFDLDSKLIQDDLELGLRVACALYVENETSDDNFIRLLSMKYRMR